MYVLLKSVIFSTYLRSSHFAKGSGGHNRLGAGGREIVPLQILQEKPCFRESSLNPAGQQACAHIHQAALWLAPLRSVELTYCGLSWRVPFSLFSEETCFYKHVLQGLECPVLKSGCLHFLLLSNKSPKVQWLETTPIYYPTVSVGQRAEHGESVFGQGLRRLMSKHWHDAAHLEWEGLPWAPSACLQNSYSYGASCFLAGRQWGALSAPRGCCPVLDTGTSSTGPSPRVCLFASKAPGQGFWPAFKGVTG